MGVVGRLDQYASMLATEFDDYSMSENLLKYSNDFSQGVWAGYCGGKSNITYNTTDVVSPDGRNDATKVARSSNGCDGSLSWGFLWDISTGGIIIDTTNTFTASIYARGAVGGEVINIGFNDSQMTNHTLTTSWQRISRTGIANTTDRGFQVKSDTINQTFYIWEGQLEKGSVATDYTPTTTTAISRVLPATTNTNITGLGTYYSSGFYENVGFTTTLTANVFPPYDLVYDEFGGTLFGAGQGRYMRQYTDKSVIVYNEIDEITDFRDIVRNGLILDLDAGMNASYNGSGTIWTDLSGGATNFTLTNPTYYSYSSSNNGSILFTRTTSPTPEDGGYATTTTTGSLSALTYLHNDHTTEVWFRSNNRNPTNYDGTEYYSALVVYTGFHSMFYYDATTFGYTIWGKDGSNANAAYTLSFSNSSVGTWNQIVARRSGTELKLYLNGVLQNTGTINVLGTGTPTSNTLRLATANYNGSFSWHSDVNIAALKMYNKALTDNEIIQNYNALKHRFGL